METLDIGIGEGTVVVGTFSLNAKKAESPVTMEGATGLTFSEVESRSEKGSSTRF